MFDIGAPELLVIAIVAIFAIGPKELPHAMRTAGRWIGKFRRISGSFRTGIDAMVREAEMEDMDRKWREQNARIMAQYPDEEMTGVNEEPGTLSAAEAREAQASASGKKAASSLPETSSDAEAADRAGRVTDKAGE
ncbi:Sec-independent protein translocase protein TatB [Erythrobacteraceae bacterium WH01K]|nr:Sec-independent protein translocase protein TatB [Erythrobacteraceae bacterium WH01K]